MTWREKYDGTMSQLWEFDDKLRGLALSLPDGDSLPPFNAIAMSATRERQLKTLCHVAPPEAVGVFGGVEVRVGAYMPDDVAALMHGDQIVAIIRLGAKPPTP